MSLEANLTGVISLNLNVYPYAVTPDGIIGGPRSWRRIIASSPFMDGEVTVHAALAQASGTCTVEVTGLTAPELQTHIEELIEAFEQWNYELHVVINGAAFAWKCELADSDVQWGRTRWDGLMVPVVFTFPRYPIPLTGYI